MSTTLPPTLAKESKSDQYAPRKTDKFTFGLWTVGNRGRDPFGDAVRNAIPPTRIVQKLAELGAYGVSLHDNDLVPIDATPALRDQIVREFKQALKDYDLQVPMATVNLFYHPIFKDGAFTSNDPRVRNYAIQKTMSAMDLGHELGAKIFVLWGGREGVEIDACREAGEGIKRMREALNFLCEYSISQDYGYKFALEAKPNEPRSDIYFPTSGHMLAFVYTLDHPEIVGLNPEVAHEQMSGLNFYHGVSQAIEAGKLFHIDLNDQKPGRYDQDLRFGSETIKGMFYLVKLLEESGYTGPKAFDAHAYRTEDEDGVWAFAYGCMRTYNLFKQKARLFAQDSEIQGILSEQKASFGKAPVDTSKFSTDSAAKLRTTTFDINAIAEKGLNYEELDQLVIDLLLGFRG